MGDVTTVGGIESFGLTASGLDTDAKLLPCPFCGHQAAVRVTEEGKWRMEMPPPVWPYSVECANTSCGVRTPAHYKTREDAIKAWNRRNGEWQPETPPRKPYPY